MILKSFIKVVFYTYQLYVNVLQKNLQSLPNAGLGNKMAEAQRSSERYGDGFAGPGGHSTNLEAWR